MTCKVRNIFSISSNFYSIFIFTTMKSFCKDQHFQVHNLLVNDLSDRFFKRESAKVAANLEELMLKGLKGNFVRSEASFQTDRFKKYKSEAY